MKNHLSVGFLFDDTLDSTDGVAQHVKTLGAWLSGSGHQVSYLVGETKMHSWSGGNVFSLARNIAVTFNGNRMSIPALSRKAEIAKVLAGQRFDVLHVMAPYSPLMSQRAINLASPGTAVVGTFHIFPSGPLSSAGTRLLRVIYGRSLKRIATMISVSRPAAGFCRQALGVPSIVIPNPVVMSAYRPGQKPPAHPKQIVFLGRLVKRKGCEQLIKAFAALRNELTDVELIVAGDGPQRQKLEQLSASLGVKDKTSFMGRITEAEKPRLLASADIACFPSLYGESFGVVLVEAMAAGAKTILAGDNPGYRSVLGSRPASLVDPRNTVEFSRRLKKFLTDEDLGRELSKWQRQSAKQYDVEVVGPQVEAVYRAAIARLAKNRHNDSHESR